MYFAGVQGTGSALPEKVITNHDLEKIVETSDQWITDRTGIRERRQAAPNETTSTLSVKASKIALEKAGLKPTDLDLIICSTISPDMPLPSTASLIQRDLGATGCCAFDLAAACSGFLFGMTVAEQFIRTGASEHVLVIGAELLSRYLDYKDRATCVIFGDGVAAAVFGPGRASCGNSRSPSPHRRTIRRAPLYSRRRNRHARFLQDHRGRLPLHQDARQRAFQGCGPEP